MSDGAARSTFTERDARHGSGVEGAVAPSRRAVLRGLGGAGLVAAAAGLVAPGTARAQEATPEAGEGGTLSTQDISLEQAQAVVAAALEKAAGIGTKMDVAVVDAGANLKAFARMDGAWLGSIDIAIKKARTARFFDFPTGALGELSQPGGPLYQIEVSNGGLITFPGGLPLKAADGTVIGAIGVSGSTVEDDAEVAEAGAAAIG